MHKQPVYKNAPAYVNGVSEAIFKVGMCLPAGPYVSDEDVKFIVETIESAINRYKYTSISCFVESRALGKGGSTFGV